MKFLVTDNNGNSRGTHETLDDAKKCVEGNWKKSGGSYLIYELAYRVSCEAYLRTTEVHRGFQPPLERRELPL